MDQNQQIQPEKSTDEESQIQSFSLGVNKQTEVNQETGEIEEIDVTELSNAELIKRAEEYTETLELEKAVALYDEGLRRFPNDCVIMDAYTDLLLQLDQFDKARELIERSIQLNPKKEGRKYLNFAEMLKGAESLQMYKQGIEVLQIDYNSYLKGLRSEDAATCQKQIASSWASIATLYMTDLSDEQDAEKNCEAALKEALNVDQNNIDALQTLANLRMVRSKDDEARPHLIKVCQIIQQQIDSVQQGNAQTSTQLPSADFRLQTSRLLFELKEFKRCVKILDSIIQEDDEIVETWYLLAFCLVKLDKHTNANECIQNVEMLIKKQKITNQEFIDGTKELKDTITAKLGPSDNVMGDDQDMEEDGEGYETYSEEDCSDDDQGKKNEDKMKD